MCVYMSVFVHQVSQIMMGVMVMSYSIPLHLTEATEVVNLGVPWWSGLMVSLCVFKFVLMVSCPQLPPIIQRSAYKVDWRL